MRVGDRPDLYVRLLGVPEFILDDQRISFATRKTAALCTFVACQASRHVDRTTLSALLWGSSEDHFARGSLRQALSMIRRGRETDRVIGCDRTTVWFAGDPANCDLAHFHECIALGTERGYREALALWRAEPLAGFELGESAFDDWAADFRQNTVSFAYRYLSERLAGQASHPGTRRTEIALCELITRLEPADTPATERLMALHAADGNKTAAARQYRAYARAIEDLDLAVPDDVAALARSIGIVPQGAKAASTKTPHHGMPTVALQRPSGMRPTPDLFSYAHSEVMCQLTRFRSMRCFEAMPGEAEDQAAPIKSDPLAIRLNSGMTHDYRLLLWNEPNARALYLRCVNAHRADTVSCVRLGYDDLEDRQAAERIIASAVNTIEQDILNDETPDPDSPFARWLVAYKQMQSFTARSDEAAYEILDDLSTDPAGSRLSLVHSSISAIMMKRRMYNPGLNLGGASFDQSHECIEKALSLDAHEPFNHVMAGWLALQERQHDRAMAAFDNALALNPYSSRTLISAAEAKAFCSDIAGAQLLATRAMELSGRYAPSYFHSYLATIAYLAGDLDECLRRLHMSPTNMHTLLLAIAAHQERNEPDLAAAARVNIERELRRMEPDSSFDIKALSRWVVTSNMTKDTGARRRMFGSLESAGVPVSQEAG